MEVTDVNYLSTNWILSLFGSSSILAVLLHAVDTCDYTSPFLDGYGLKCGFQSCALSILGFGTMSASQAICDGIRTIPPVDGRDILLLCAP